MSRKIIIKRSKPNYFSIAMALIMFYYFYDNMNDGQIVIAVIALIVGVVGLVHNLLLLSTPLLVQDNGSLVVKPKIPFERKVLLIEEIVEVKALSESILMIMMLNQGKIKLDMGGFKEKEIVEARKYLQSLF